MATSSPPSATAPMAPSSLTLIVAATTRTLGIGKSGALPWRLKNEMSYFARTTKGILPKQPLNSNTKNVVIMGRKTWESIPSRPLRGRINVVVSEKNTSTGEDVIWVKSLDDALEYLDSGAGLTGGLIMGRIFIIGGARLYGTALKHPRTRNILLTSVHHEFDVDTFFPVDVKDPESGWRKRTHEELEEFVGDVVPVGMEEGGVGYDFELYQREL